MDSKIKRETMAHHSMAVVGGFFGVYALLTRNATFGSSETSNLIYLVVAGLSGSAEALLIRIGATLCYIIGIVFATVGIRFLKKFDFRYIAIFVDVIACLSLAQIPESIDPVLALYPMFFATSVQWQAYTEAAGFNSATIFSTNNLRQCFVGLTDDLCRHEGKSLHKFKFYGGTLLSFHVGVVYAWCCLQLWGIRSIYACLPLLAVTMATTFLDDDHAIPFKSHVARALHISR